MVRPQRFHANPQTAADNAFQRVEAGRADAELADGSVRCVLAGISLAGR